MSQEHEVRFAPRRHRWLGCGALVLLISLGAAAHAAAPSAESVKFVGEAARSGASLLQGARIAQKTSKDASVREFASRMTTDYSQANDTLMELCRRRNIPLPQQSDGANVFSDITGETFDRVYTLETTQQLAKADGLFSTASQSARLDPELKEFARRRLETIREQARRAGNLAKSQAGVRAGS